VPGPARGQVKRPGSPVAGEPPGDLKPAAAQGAVRRARLLSGRPISCVHLMSVVRERSEHRPGTVGGELAEGKCKSAWSFRSAITCSTTA